ncbi:VOC family protein [Nocardioides sp.]|uniref:VOC family protein n=1 Tax=Nocardioides sp. TaxID=35761 RepID=UPI002B62744F|nr:VOC family protein [Nocardioides sp.]HXH77701.1 VOC family protein [Nocardioides sp.]
MFWMSAFLDVPAPDFERSVTFWSAVTGYAPSARRGAEEEFLTLVPPVGDDHLRMQRVGDGPPRIHLDLHVDQPRTAADRAVALGGVEISNRGYVVMRSPGGLTFCFVSHPVSQPAPPASWAGGSVSIVDQVCLDIPAAIFDGEAAFWQELLQWPLKGSAYAEFERLVRPDGQAFGILLQRVGDDGPVRAHLDLACSSRESEVQRHLALGARVVVTRDRWTVLEDPAALPYCLTDRSPQ